MSGAFTWARASAFSAPSGAFVSRLVFSQRLELRQSQALVMTPQLQQAIKMLQLSNLELAEFVEAEIEQNPLLEHAPREAEEGAATADPDGTAAPERDRLPLPQALAADVAADAAEHLGGSAGRGGGGHY